MMFRNSAFAADENGMTLMDMAIMLMVIGLIAGPMLKAYDLWRQDKSYGDSLTSMDVAESAIKEFYFTNGRYPCPANPALSAANANYGQEVCPGIADADNVLEGALPFASLKIPEDVGFDGWGRKLTYAVSQAQADFNLGGFAFNANGGVIQINGNKTDFHPDTDEEACDFDLPSYDPDSVDGKWAEVADINKPAAHYLLFSHGTRGVGATNADGVVAEACIIGADATAESENCDGDAVFFHHECAGGGGANAGYYDDQMVFAASVPSRIWSPSTSEAMDTVSNVGFIGIGTPSPTVELDVVGNIKADRPNPAEAGKNGNAMALDLCTNDADEDNNATTCFNPTIITGSDPNMRCENTNAMSGIGGNRARCDVKYIAGGGTPCTGDQIMYGLDEDGNPKCKTPEI